MNKLFKDLNPISKKEKVIFIIGICILLAVLGWITPSLWENLDICAVRIVIVLTILAGILALLLNVFAPIKDDKKGGENG